MSDTERMSELVRIWWQAIDDFTTLLETVPADEWATPTDLPGWDVHAVAAHTAHLESLLAGAEHDDVEIGDVPHARGMMGRFTEQGVVARRGLEPDEVINQIREAATARHTRLLAAPPSDPDVAAPGLFGVIGWTTLRLLRNRPLDVWMHDQDVRRAVGRPGGMDTDAAAHAASYLAESLPVVVAKRAAAPEGTTVTLDVAGHDPVGVAVGGDGRGALVDPPASPTVTLRTDRESFVLLAGGRRPEAAERVEVAGDTDLGSRILQAMAVTP